MDVDDHHHPSSSTIFNSLGLLMKKIKNIRVFDVIALALLCVCLLYIFLSSPSSNDNPFFTLRKYSQCHPSDPTIKGYSCFTPRLAITGDGFDDSRPQTSYLPPSPSRLPNIQNNMIRSDRDELEEVLAETSMENKIVIIALVNKAYVEGEKSMLDLFLDSFWLGENTQALKDHLLIVALDQTSYERCRFLGLHCYKLETDGVDFAGEQYHLSDDYLKMLGRRTQFLGDVLKRGYSFIFTDTDIMWLRNPFPRLNLDETLDLQISTDRFNGNERSKDNPINAGFYMVRSNDKTIALFNSWYARKDNSTGMLDDQYVLQTLLKEPAVIELGLTVRFLDTLYFSGFCQTSRDVRLVVTIHANCCRSISAKVADLTEVILGWKRFKRDSTFETLTDSSSKHVACKNSWKD